MWLADLTRSDIINMVQDVARLAHHPSATHWKAVCKVSEHIKRTGDLGPNFHEEVEAELTAFMDSGYAKDKAHRQSLSGGYASY